MKLRQHVSRTNLDDDRGARVDQSLHKLDISHRSDQLLDQVVAQVLRVGREAIGHAAQEGDRRGAQRTDSDRCPQCCADRRHERRVEGSGDRQSPRFMPLALQPQRDLRHGVRATRNDRLTRRVVIRNEHAVRQFSGLQQHFHLGSAGVRREHAPLDAAGDNGAAAEARHLDRLLEVPGLAGDKRGILSIAVGRNQVWLHAARSQYAKQQHIGQQD